MHILSLFRRRGFTRADRPDRLVSDYDTFRVGESQPSQPRRKLVFYYEFRITGLSLREVLANANDRSQTSFDRSFCLLIDGIVRLAKKLPPLAVAYDYVLAPNILDHRRSDLAG